MINVKPLHVLAAFAISLLMLNQKANAWSGFDYSNGSHVEIESGNLVRPGQDIKIYDYSSGEYKNVTVESIDGYGSSVEVEVYDYEAGEYRTLDMDR